MIEVPKQLIEETRRLVRFFLFLRYDCGLKAADKLTAKELKELSRVQIR